MIKIEIKNRYTGSILFKYKAKDNTIKKTLEEAVRLKKDLQGAVLQGAYLQGAYLQGADLQGAYLQGAYLQGADLQGAVLLGYKIKKAIVFTGLYSYIVISFVTEESEKRIVMGCYNRSLAEWTENFWNNNSEFPNDNSEASQLRLMAFETAKKWFEIVESK